MLKILKKVENNVVNKIIKKLLIVSIIVTNLFVYMPITAFAVDDSKKEYGAEKYPALVPAYADAIISKFVTTGVIGGKSSSSASSRITDNSESGDGWLSTTTVTYPNGVTRIYRNYKQGSGSYAGNHYWEGNIASDGCGPTAISIVLSGYGYEGDPGKVVDVMINKYRTDGSYAFENLINALEYLSDNTVTGEPYYGEGTSSDIQTIRDNFNKGNPVIVNAPGHYIVLLGEDENGKLKVSDPAYKFYGGDGIDPYAYQGPDTLEEFVNQGMIDCGYIYITSTGNSNQNSISNTNTTTNTTNNISNLGLTLRWPIGSMNITTRNGKKFADGTPAIGLGQNVSRGGVSQGWSSSSHPKEDGEALDIEGGGQSNYYNVIAMGNGRVIDCGDGIPDGTNGNRRNG